MDTTTAGAILVIANKLLGKTADKISEDIATLYISGRDKIIQVATRKIPNINDGGQTNLRVTRDVFWGGSFTDEAICAEYFGGILASARSEDGKDDSGVYYVDIIKSLSAAQLHLHYIIYRVLNKLLCADITKKALNVGLSTQLINIHIYVSSVELGAMGVKVETDLEALYRKGLLHEYKYDYHKLNESKNLPYIMAAPTTLGIQLFSIANNKLPQWRSYPIVDFGDFENIEMPLYFGFSVEDIIKKIEV